MLTPTYKLEVAWNTALSGIFTVGQSLVGGTDVVGGALDGAGFNDISADLYTASWERGRGADLGPMQAGRLEVALNDSTGKYNLENVGLLINLCPNPSFETDLTGWTEQEYGSVAATLTVSRSTDKAYKGSYSAKLAQTTAGEDDCLEYNPSALPNTTYTISAYVDASAATSPAIGNRGLWVTDRTTNWEDPLPAAKLGVAGWQRLSVSFTTAAGAYDLLVRLYAPQGTVYWDAAQLEMAAAPTAYCDGDQDNCRWAGTAHASQSYRGGPLYNYLLPLRPIRLRATYGGTTYGLFYGYIEEISHDTYPNAQKSYIRAVDLFERLANRSPIIAATGATNVGTAIGLVLDACGWTMPSMRSLDLGRHIPNFSADGATKADQLITDLLAADGGTFFIAGSGVATYHSAASRYKTQSPMATLTSAMTAFGRPTMTVRKIINKQTVTRTGGVARTASDATSIQRYDTREGAPVTSSYLMDDGQAASLAGWLIFLQKAPRPPVREVPLVKGGDAALQQMLVRELDNLVTASVDTAGNTVTGWIDHLRGTIDPGGLLGMTYIIRKRTFATFRVGTSTVGGADVIGY